MFTKIFRLTCCAVMFALTACTPEPGNTQNPVPAAPSWDGTSPPTAAQYRAAEEASRQCMIGRGFEVSELTLKADGRTLEYSVSPKNAKDTDADADELSRIWDECNEKHKVDEIYQAYLESLRVPPEQRAAVMKELQTCLKDAGVEYVDPEPADSRVYVKAINALEKDSDAAKKAWECMSRYRTVWPKGDPNNP